MRLERKQCFDKRIRTKIRFDVQDGSNGIESIVEAFEIWGGLPKNGKQKNHHVPLSLGARGGL